ncbi:DUF317 domain-containing protein [[Kitasatospora] papulosa]|uniref:DUF317 domain-containing protein n=1 Tax=[Kitasatospora] papulosa TaxID=1464011 RepID=UPI0036884418
MGPHRDRHYTSPRTSRTSAAPCRYRQLVRNPRHPSGREDRDRLHPPAHRSRVAPHGGRARYPLDIPHGRRRSPVRCLRSPAPEPQPGWTIWGGPSPDRPAWTLTASPYTPSSLLADLSENLAYGTGTRQKPATSRQRQTRPATTSPAVPVTTGACHLPSRTR